MRKSTWGLLVIGGVAAVCLCALALGAGLLWWRMQPDAALHPAFADPAGVPPTARAASPNATVDASASGIATPDAPASVSEATAAPTPERVDPGPPGDPSKQRALLDQFCKTVSENYVDPKLNGVNWDGECAALASSVDGGISDAELFVLLEALMRKLDDDHSTFIPRTRERRVADSLGIDANRADDASAVVLTVGEGSPAHVAGVRAHDRVIAIDGASPFGPNGAIDRRLRDAPMPDAVTLSVASPGAQVRDVIVRRDAATAPVDYAQLSSRLIEPGLGLITVPSFAEPGVADRVREAFAALTRENGGPLRALILDLRTNGGGDISNLRDMLALFGQGVAGYNVTRDDVRAELDTQPAPEGNSGQIPIWILISRHTDSAADVFAGVMQHWKRATLVGERSAGNTETVFTYTLDDGSAVRVAEMRFELPDGRSWDKRVGLTPDIALPLRWEDYTAQDDPVLARAIAAAR
jgi:carboxyl-terminal processing protease